MGSLKFTWYRTIVIWSPYSKTVAVSGTGAVLRKVGYPRVNKSAVKNIAALQNTVHKCVYCPTDRLDFFTVVGMEQHQVPKSLSYKPLLRDRYRALVE